MMIRKREKKTEGNTGSCVKEGKGRRNIDIQGMICAQIEGGHGALWSDNLKKHKKKMSALAVSRASEC